MPPRIRFILQLFPHLSRSNRRADSAQQICHRFRKSQRSKKTPQCAHTGTRERNSAGPSAAPSPGPRAARQMSGYSAPSQTHAPPEPRPEYDPESAAASPSGAAWGLQSAANRQPEPVSQRAPFQCAAPPRQPPPQPAAFAPDPQADAIPSGPCDGVPKRAEIQDQHR